MMALIDAPEAPPHVIRIDIDPAEMTRLRVHAPVVADAAAGARALIEALRERRRDAQGHVRISRRRKPKRRQDDTRSSSRISTISRVIRAALPDDGFFVEELCQAGFTSFFGYDVRAPRTYVSAGFRARSASAS